MTNTTETVGGTLAEILTSYLKTNWAGFTFQ